MSFLALLVLLASALAVPFADSMPEAAPEALPDAMPGPLPESLPGAGPWSAPASLSEPLAADEALAPRDEFSSGLVVRAPKDRKNCSVGQINQCSTGIPYCCSTGADGHTCVKSDVNCQQQVICCNNNFGYQLCIGAIDFNIPITININL